MGMDWFHAVFAVDHSRHTFWSVLALLLEVSDHIEMSGLAEMRRKKTRMSGVAVMELVVAVVAAGEDQKPDECFGENSENPWRDSRHSKRFDRKLLALTPASMVWTPRTMVEASSGKKK
jgi:hypothetical protein